MDVLPVYCQSQLYHVGGWAVLPAAGTGLEIECMTVPWPLSPAKKVRAYETHAYLRKGELTISCNQNFVLLWNMGQRNLNLDTSNSTYCTAGTSKIPIVGYEPWPVYGSPHHIRIGISFVSLSPSLIPSPGVMPNFSQDFGLSVTFTGEIVFA